MKKMKKIMCLLLALVMVLGMGMTAFAVEANEEETVNITVESSSLIDNHKFTAYQIFKGTQAADDDLENILGDIDWGSGINPAAFVDALTSSDKFGNPNVFAGIVYDPGNSDVSAAKVAEALLKLTPLQLNDVAQIAYNNKTEEGTPLEGVTQMTPGYYLIVDTTADVGEDGVWNASLLQATKDVNIKVKTDKPSAEKKVQENEKGFTPADDQDRYGDGYNDVADYNIGDEVPYAFYSNVPDMTQYETYKFIFHDKMDAGLTFDITSVVVKIGNTTLTAGTDYTVIQNSDDGCTFEIDFGDLKTTPGAVTGAEIRIDFKATLNENAVIGRPGNKNGMKLQYSNKPDVSGSGENDNETGETPLDEVIVFTYELDVTKVDGTKDENGNFTKYLKDAEFVLYRGTDPDIEYVVVDENSKVTGWTKELEKASTLKSDDNGLFSVIGLDDGTYYLQETKAPNGYNLKTEPIVIVIDATTDNGHVVGDITGELLEDLEIKVDDGDAVKTDDENKGAVGTTVENNRGSLLPETGGIGTTIFYVVGGILVVCCGLVLVTRKRVSR